MNVRSGFKALLDLLGLAALAAATNPATAQTAPPSTGTYSYQTAPAIYVEITNLIVSPAAPSAGQPTAVKLAIRNAGKGTVAKVPWTIHGYTSNQTLGQGEILNLAPGALVEVSANWNPPPGSQTLQGYVDPTGKTFNNTAPASAKFRQLVVDVAPGRQSFCFGAAGAECGDGGNQQGPLGTCANGRCSINAGSWEHDTCCWNNPNGYYCRSGATGDQCHVAFDKAVTRLRLYTWQRDIDYNRANTTGIVVFTEYCAQTGAIVQVNDVQYCCKGTASALGQNEYHPDKTNARRCN
ncbi:MAG TPA: CARDB domain-containing protein [Solimonas sp.]|nr:CARDB domain-containing protein [Solimonas sp.]